MRRGLASDCRNSFRSALPTILRSLCCCEELRDPIGLEVPDGDALAVIVDVEGEVLAHDAESDHAELCRADGRCGSCAHLLTSGAKPYLRGSDRLSAVMRPYRTSRAARARRGEDLPQSANDVGAEIDADRAAPAFRQRLEVAQRLRLFQNAEAKFLARQRNILRVAGDELQEDAAVGAALVQLSGGVQEARAIAGGGRDAVLSRTPTRICWIRPSISGVSSMYCVIAK